MYRRLALILLFVLVTPRLIFADEWEDLFQELNKPKANQNQGAGQQASPAAPKENAPLPTSKPMDLEDASQDKSAESVNPVLTPDPTTPVPTKVEPPIKNQLSPDVQAMLQDDEPVRQPRKVDTKPLTESDAGNLVNLNDSRALRKTDDLERRVLDLEKDNRLLVEKVRNLTRTVDDIKRRR